MKNLLTTIINEDELRDLKEFITLLTHQDKIFFLRNDILLAFQQYCDNSGKDATFREKSSIITFFKKVQELCLQDKNIVIVHRYAIAKYRFYQLLNNGEYLEEISQSQFLDLRDNLASVEQPAGRMVHIDLMPFYDSYPSVRDTKAIGSGIRFMNRYLCSGIFQKPEVWHEKIFEFLKLHKYNDQQLLVNDLILPDFKTFIRELEGMVAWLARRRPEEPFSAVEIHMKKAGFEVGWGNTVGRIVETMQILIDLINEPTAPQMEELISRVPMPLISKIAIISPHGWFGQENVLGMPDTGGQVIYILDQVRALEKHLKEEIELTGLNIAPKIIVLTRLIPEAGNTPCNIKKEKIFQTENSWILRVPFRDKDSNVIKQWISRFKIWPYLENFVEDSEVGLRSEFMGRPDLIIGNYSDGNLVASLLSDRFDVIQCTIAHALEKTKYLFSDLYWRDMESDYNFSLQFTADLISMNKADFIITSTNQEILGTEDTIGQYEAYQFFTMPGLYQVENGTNLYAPKFNVIPPGVDMDLYFPYELKEKRIASKTEEWEKRLFYDESDDIYGALTSPEKIPIFTMARFDKIKNITGLIEAFGLSEKLQEKCNLVFAAGTIHAEESKDAEEQAEIKKAYEMIEKYQLYNKVRWLPSINKLDTGEVYRIIADHKGMFVQPALFEAFGLTILEAMVSGLPTCGPIFGGPLEIIEEGVSGILLNTSKSELIAEGLEKFLEACEKDAGYWESISRNGAKRVQEHFTWELYSERLIKLTKLYGLWRYSTSGPGQEKMNRYCDLLYHFLFQERAGRLEEMPQRNAA